MDPVLKHSQGIFKMTSTDEAPGDLHVQDLLVITGKVARQVQMNRNFKKFLYQK